YFHCTSDHYFAGRVCMDDGWSSDGSRLVAEAVTRLLADERDLTMDALRERGVSEEDLQRVIIVEFARAKDAWDFLEPATLRIGGKEHVNQEVRYRCIEERIRTRPQDS